MEVRCLRYFSSAGVELVFWILADLAVLSLPLHLSFNLIVTPTPVTLFSRAPDPIGSVLSVPIAVTYCFGLPAFASTAASPLPCCDSGNSHGSFLLCCSIQAVKSWWKRLCCSSDCCHCYFTNSDLIWSSRRPRCSNGLSLVTAFLCPTVALADFPVLSGPLTPAASRVRFTAGNKWYPWKVLPESNLPTGRFIEAWTGRVQETNKRHEAAAGSRYCP